MSTLGNPLFLVCPLYGVHFKSRLLKLTGEHIQFVFDCLRKNTTQVRELYNASATTQNYYAAQVRHDLYGSSA